MADDLCRWCGKSWSWHDDEQGPNAPVPRVPCLGLKSGFVEKTPAPPSEAAAVSAEGPARRPHLDGETPVRGELGAPGAEGAAAPSADGRCRRAECLELRNVIDSPQTEDFLAAVKNEAAHQVARWGSDHDAGKAPADWFWLLGYLGGKALAAAIKGDVEKAKHHTISSAAALMNWHAALSGDRTSMRPGIEPPDGGTVG